MADGDTISDGAPDLPQSVGERLRTARNAAGMDLQDVATKTRVPTRHLAAIERSEYAGLPSQTYALGFARAYARAIGADEKAIVRDLRIELTRAPADVDRLPAPYEPTDLTRVPSRLLAYTALGVLVLVLAAYLLWRDAWWDGAADTGSAASVVAAAPPSATSATLAEPVVLTANAPVWLRIYDRSRTTLFEKEMTRGERYIVPADSDQPMILTGRPEVLAVTIGGRPVAPLGGAEVTVRDLPISAAALEARAQTGEVPATTVAEPDASGNTNGI